MTPPPAPPSRLPFIVRLSTAILFVLTALLGTLPQHPVLAANALTVTPVTWNVVGLDSNNVLSGPNAFPVGARACNTGSTPITNLTSSFNWLDNTYQQNIFIREGTNPAYPAGVTLAAGACKDFFYEIEILRSASSYSKTRGYSITFTGDGGITGSTPTPREIYVERLVSQNRNAVLNIALDGVSIPAGGTMNLKVGQTYQIKLTGSTSTGYNQLESYINLSNTYFRINSVKSTFSTTSLAPSTSTLLYADSCGWDNNPSSPTYRSCIVSDGKSGGTVTIDYNVTILSASGTSETLNSMFFDYSGSSYHYNADYSTSARFVKIESPIGLSKSFTAKSAVAGSTTPLVFTLVNSTDTDLPGIAFIDSLPSSPAQMTIADPAGVSYSEGCMAGSVLSAAPGDSQLSFSGGVKGLGTCTISINVQVPASPESGTYPNTSGDLFLGLVDTGQQASANLNVAPVSVGTGICGIELASWSVSNTSNPPTSTVVAGVTAAASAGAGISTSIDSTIGNPVNSWKGYDFVKGTTLSTAQNEYFQFSATTTGYTSIGFQFDARLENSQRKGPRAVALYSSTDGINYTQYGTIIAPTEAYVTYNQTFTGTSNAGGQTYFRIYPYDPGNPGNADYIYLDNIKITGCGTPKTAGITKSFSPDIISAGGKSRLTFSLSNPNTTNLTGVKFTDPLPAGLTVAAPSNITNSCGGTFTASGSEISLTGGTIPPAGCSIAVDVSGLSAGTYVNTSGFISALESGTNSGEKGSAAATLNIVDPPVFSKSFSPKPIYAGEDSALTFTISNPNPVMLTGIGFTDNLYTDATNGHLTVSDPSGAVSSNCNAAGSADFSLTTVPGTNFIQMSGASIAPDAVCSVTVRVTADRVFDYPNSAELTTGVTGLTVSPASDTLPVIDHYPGLKLTKQIASAAGGPWSSFISVAPSSSVYYRLIVENIGDVTLNNLSISDPGVDLSSCKWPTALFAGSPTQDPSVTCVVGPFTSTASGSQTNTATASATYNSQPYTSTAAAQYAISDLSLSKNADQPYFASAGEWLTYTYVVANNGVSVLTGPVTVFDNLSTVTCPDLTTVGNLDSNMDPGEQLTCASSYLVSTENVNAGSVTNSAVARVGGESSPTARKTVYTKYPDLTVTKSNNIGGYGTGGTAFNWQLLVNNEGPVEAVFTSGQVILRDALPAGANYSVSAAQSLNAISGSGTIHCAITSGILECAASGGEVVIGAGGGRFSVTITTTPTAGGSISNTAEVDPGKSITECSESNNTGTDIVSVTSSTPSISLSKTASIATYSTAGSVVTYDYEITNTGSITLTGPFTVTDDKTAVTCDPTPEGGLASHASLHCSADYVITQADMDAGSVTNTASASGGGVTSNSDSVTLTAVHSTGLSLAKSASPVTFSAAGTVIQYSYLLTNTGNVTLNAPFVVSDDKVTVSCPSSPSSLAPGGTLTCTASTTITQSDLDAGSISNTASASGYDESDLVLSNSDTETVTAAQAPELSLTKTAEEAGYSVAGNILHFTVTARNSGNITLNSVVISDPLLADLSCTPSQPATLAPGTSLVCTGSHAVTQAEVDSGWFTNSASVSAEPVSGGTVSDSASITLNASQTSAITLTKTASATHFSTPPAVGDSIEYQLAAENSGNTTLTSVVISDPLLPALTCDQTAPVSLDPGAKLTCSGTYTLLQQDLNAGKVDNTASVSSNLSDGSSAGPSDTESISVSIPRSVSLSIGKSAFPTTYSSVGTVIQYSYLLTNIGNVTLSAPFTVNDDQVTVTCPSTPASLAPADTLICTASYSVLQSDLDAGSITNTAAASGFDGATQVTSASDEVTVNAVQNPQLGLAKQIVGSPVKTSSTTGAWDVTYEILVHNYGNVTLSHLQVTDNLITAFTDPVTLDIPTTFNVLSLSSTEFTVNWPGYDGGATPALLQGADSLAPGSEGKITLVVRVIPATAGPFQNSATASALEPNADPILENSQNGTDPDPDHDGNTGNNSSSTTVNFGPSLFDPPAGIKTFDDSGLPLIQWTVVWINNSNVVALDAFSSDAVPAGSSYVDDGVPSGYPLPAGAPAGSTSNGVACTDSSAVTTTVACYYEGPTAGYPQGRVNWQGTLGPDLAAADAESAVNELSIHYALQLSTGTSNLTNTAELSIDQNKDGSFTGAGETAAAEAANTWTKQQAPAAVESAAKVAELPQTGFAPSVFTLLPEPPIDLAYTHYESLVLEIPSLGVKSSILGVPMGSNGWNISWLGSNTGWLNGTAFPTWIGNSVLTGHVVTADGKPGPFYKLGKLAWDDIILIHSYGQIYTYEVRQVKTVKPDDLSALDHEDRAWLTLITCKNYDPNLDFYQSRVVVKAVLVKVEDEK